MLVIPNTRQWTRQDIITRPVRPTRPSCPLSLDDDFSPLISPRSPVDSLFLSFLPNVFTSSFSAPRLRLGNVDLPQAVSRVAPSSLVGLGRLSHSLPPFCRLSASVICRFCPNFHRERQGEPALQLRSCTGGRFFYCQLSQVHGPRSQSAVHGLCQWDPQRC